MSRQIQIRRGTTVEHETFTGVTGEVTMDTDKKTLCVHDGVTAGGVPLARKDDVPETFELPANYDFVIDSGSNANGWYRKYKSGWVEQGGTYNKTSSTVNVFEDVNITLPVQMASTDYTGFVNGSRILDGAYGTTSRLIPNTVTDLILQFYNIYGSASQIINWELKGYFAT